MTISQRILSQMEKKGSTQAQLSQITGIPKSTISAWKTRGSSPSAEDLSAIADFLEVSVIYLLTGEEKQPLDEPMSNNERQFIDKFNRLKDIDKGKILERMDVIYESYPPAAVQEPQDGFSEPAEPTAASLDQKKHLA